MFCRIVKVCCDALAQQAKSCEFITKNTFSVRKIDFNENQRLLCSTVTSELRRTRRKVYRHIQVVVLQVCVHFSVLLCFAWRGRFLRYYIHALPSTTQAQKQE